MLEELNMRKYILYFLIIFSCFSKIFFEEYRVENFEKKRIEGTWFEVVKILNKYVEPWDYSTTTYTGINDKEFIIETRGYDNKKKKNQSAKGIGKIKDNSNIIEANFFGFLKRDYIILDYDKKNYTYMAIRGEDSEAFWILSRKPNLDKEIVEELIKTGEKTGIKKDKLIYIRQK